MRISALLLGACPLFCGFSAMAKAPIVVGVGTCNINIPQYTTIQSAVDSTPATAIIQICPGRYPEQVSIGKALTLQGVTDGSGTAATIVAPSGGIVGNAPSVVAGSSTIFAAQIVVQNASVSISNLTIDGSNNGINGCTPVLTGILYQNSSGTLKSNAIVNEVTPAVAGCQSGLGIYVQTAMGNVSKVTALSNHVENYQKNGITGDEAGTTLTATGNTVVGQGSTMGAAENSIQIGFGATGTVSGNVVGDDVYGPDNGDPSNAAAGILLYASPNTKVTGNVVSDTQYGIVVTGDGDGDGDSAMVTGNRVQNTHIFDGIDVCGAGNATISNNTVNGSDEAAIHLDSSCGSASIGNTVSGNKVNLACAGILVGPSSKNVPKATDNTVVNAGTNILNNSDTCPATGSGNAARHRNLRHPAPVRF